MIAMQAASKQTKIVALSQIQGGGSLDGEKKCGEIPTESSYMHCFLSAPSI